MHLCVSIILDEFGEEVKGILPVVYPASGVFQTAE